MGDEGAEEEEGAGGVFGAGCVEERKRMNDLIYELKVTVYDDDDSPSMQSTSLQTRSQSRQGQGDKNARQGF